MLTLTQLSNRPASIQIYSRIHVESLAYVLDQVGGLLAVGKLSVSLDSAASWRRVFQLIPGKEPFRRRSPVHRHYAPTAKPDGVSIGWESGCGTPETESVDVRRRNSDCLRTAPCVVGSRTALFFSVLRPLFTQPMEIGIFCFNVFK